ncbi:MAG: DUF6468 domain-containing protein [Xanthobacteraceae bacterium]
MNDGLGMIIDSLVAILLVFTIGYCMLLNRRLKMLRGDEAALRATIGELITATEIAERAIAGLKITARECDVGLGERLTRAERVTAELDRKLIACKHVVGHLAQIGATGKRGRARGADAMPPQQDAQATAVAAQAFAERLRNKVFGLAA